MCGIEGYVGHKKQVKYDRKLTTRYTHQKIIFYPSYSLYPSKLLSDFDQL